MPDAPLTPDKRHVAIDPDLIDAPPRALFVELGVMSCFTFLRGASDAVDLALTARALGYDALGIADANSLAGVVRLHTEAKALKLRPVIGCRIETVEGLAFLAYPRDRAAYGRLCRLISAGRMRTLGGEWQDKGACEISLAMLAAHAEGVHLIALPPRDLTAPFTIAVEDNVVAFPMRGSRGDAETRRVLARSQRRRGTEEGSAAGLNSFAQSPQRAQRSLERDPISAPSAGSARESFCACGADTPALCLCASVSESPLRVSASPREPKTRPLTAAYVDLLPHLAHQLPGLKHLAASFLHSGHDIARIERLDMLARANAMTILATNDVHHHIPERRPLQDVMTAIRHKTTVANAGHLLHANAERHLKSPQEMERLFARWPHAIRAAREVADACRFDLEELAYDYPEEICPEGRTPQEHLEAETWIGAARRYPAEEFPQGVPPSVRDTIERELALIGKLGLARYFLTIKDIVDFARGQEPPILCQGRGSAANSAVCYVLGITSVDPAKHALLFDRFISEERKEPPDIDVDFEHERREEVIQYIYRKYGRHRAGLCATVIHYRPRMAIREVGKVMGLSEDVTSALARTVWGSMGREVSHRHAEEIGMDLSDPHLRRVLALTEQMIGMPRHLGQHVGGFILTASPLTETVPIGNGAMPERSFIEWDKDDIDALGILKVDVLALGMLTCIRKCLDLLEDHHGRALTLATVPREDPETYAMLRKGDSLGVFQVESRAQMNMLPRLRPREFYDLVIQVAIVRPGPIQGDMVHPYLRRRRGAEKVEIPAPSPEHGPPDELSSILRRTLGVPIFQEQAMKIALDAARFSPAEANRLRKAMATFRSRGMVDELQDMMVERMVARGYDRDFAERCFNQIRGFGEYGFPESHAASFAHLVYVSSWLKCHFPGAFACALLNSQPMGFYAPAQIVRDAKEHGVVVLPVDVNRSEWDCTLELVSDSRGDAETRRVWGRSQRHKGTEEDSAAGALNGFTQGAQGKQRSQGGYRVSQLSVPSAFSAPSARNPLCACGADDPSLCLCAAVSANSQSGRQDRHLALRLGFRQLDGLPEHAAAMLVAAREAGGAFVDVAELRERARLIPAHVEKLASADCFGSLGLVRRQALWDARSLVSAPDLPLFAHAEARDEGAERGRAVLPAMPLSEEVVTDYQTTRLSLKAHPLAFLRASLGDRGFIRAADLRERKNRSMVQVAGVVLIRQRPGSAKGVCFITIEDETGVANVVVWPDLMERLRRVVMGARLMEVRGRVEYDDEVIHIIAQHITDTTQDLHRLSDDLLSAPLARADHIKAPLPGGKVNPRDNLREGAEDPVEPWQPPDPGNRECGFHGPDLRGHPRNLRIIPKSRDFH